MSSWTVLAQDQSIDGSSGGDRPDDVLEQAKVRKEQGFTRVKMNVSASTVVVIGRCTDCVGCRVCGLTRSDSSVRMSTDRNSLDGLTRLMLLTPRSSDWPRSSQ